MFGEFFRFCWTITVELAPWLLLGVIIAGVLHVVLPTDIVRRHLGHKRFGNVLKAALFGVPMPLCSCGVIPAAIGLKKDGASDGAAVSFLISTPQTGVDSIAVSAVFLGLPFALFKVVSAFVMGLVGGSLVNAFDHDHVPPEAVEPAAKRQHKGVMECLKGILDFAFNDLLRGIWAWILIGILISAAISTLAPAGSLADQAWANGFTGMLVMLVIALPLYVCATGSVPIAASLVAAGLPSGAALVFLMAGPATNIATLGAVHHEFGSKVTAIYLAVVAIGSVALGWVYQLSIGSLVPTVTLDMHEHAIWGQVAATGLIALLAYYAAGSLRRRIQSLRSPAGITGHDELVIRVEGLSCQNCVRHVQDALIVQHGVEGVDVDLASGRTAIRGHALNPVPLAEAIRQAGYTVR